MVIDSYKYTCEGGHEINEDSFLCRADQGIFIVADGLGGHSDGEIASSAAIRYFEKNCQGGYTKERISALLEEANEEVLRVGDGGKTTVAAAFIENGHFIYANAGDSRVYYFRNGRIIAQTKDHSVCQASVDMGLIRPEDIRGSEDRSRLLKVLGSEERLNIKKHYAPIRIENGDAFLICSDGFWDYVYESEMEADLLKSDCAEVWLKYMLKRHILRGKNKGDNYTALCGILHPDESDLMAQMPEEEQTEKKKPKRSRGTSGKKIWIVILAALLFLALLMAGFFIWKGWRKSEDDAAPTPFPEISPTVEVQDTPEAEPAEEVQDTPEAEPTEEVQEAPEADA